MTDASSPGLAAGSSSERYHLYLSLVLNHSWTGMTQALHSVTGGLRTRQLPQHRTFWCLKHSCKSANTAAVSILRAYRIRRGTGKAWDQKPSVRCNSAQGQPVQQQGPNISRLDPALQQQWDHAANAHLGNIDIRPYSNRKVWWTCDQCPDGHLHSWEATVSNRSSGRDCPQCSGRKVCKHNSLATKAPKVAAQWDYEANDGTPDDVVALSGTSVGWRCDICGHPWRATIDSRVSKSKTGCPQCFKRSKTKKRIKHPTFAECQDPHSKAVLAEWDAERNALRRNFPHDTALKSNKQIFWLCTKCSAGQEHSWTAKPCSRTSRSQPGCPFCTGQAVCNCNSLPSLYPGIAAEWDYAKNTKQPNKYTASSTSVAWWSSPQGGSWQQRIDSRTNVVQQRSARLKRIQQRQL